MQGEALQLLFVLLLVTGAPREMWTASSGHS